jgi:hypothetical protein
MNQDSIPASRPIHRTIEDADQAFDSIGITYAKGIPSSDQSEVIDSIGENLSDPRDADEVREFAKTALAPAAGPKLEETVQKILQRSALKESVVLAVNLWIKGNSGTTGH